MKSVRIELKRSCLDCNYCELEIEKVCGLITACQVLRCGHANVCKGYIGDQDPTISDCLEEEKNEWTPTRERLPKDDTFVLVQITGTADHEKFNNAIQLGSYYPADGWLIDGHFDFEGEVVAWQPLPDEYEENT